MLKTIKTVVVITLLSSTITLLEIYPSWAKAFYLDDSFANFRGKLCFKLGEMSGENTVNVRWGSWLGSWTGDTTSYNSAGANVGPFGGNAGFAGSDTNLYLDLNASGNNNVRRIDIWMTNGNTEAVELVGNYGYPNQNRTIKPMNWKKIDPNGSY